VTGEFLHGAQVQTTLSQQRQDTVPQGMEIGV
jgi:hypothetical protein